MVVTTQYVGEAGECDVVGLLSDGELLLLDTPDNLRRAAFSGEVVDVTLAAIPPTTSSSRSPANRVRGRRHRAPASGARSGSSSTAPNRRSRPSAPR